MQHITNTKVASIDPLRWAPFHGFSILFNNPGQHCLRETRPGVLELANDVHTDPTLNFYRRLHESLTRLDVGSLVDSFCLCPLPPAAYHVTLCDGLNDRRVGQLNTQDYPIAHSWLSGLPGSFCDAPKEIFELPATSPLCTRRDWNINFRFDQLAVWNDSVLVAVLRPDVSSQSTFEQLCEERRQLNEQFHHRFNVRPASEIYTPHVSLGYFANKEGAQRALSRVASWNVSFSDALQNVILSFDNASIYGLTDMSNFFQAAEHSSAK